MGILYTFNHILRAIIENLRAEVLLAANAHFIRYCCHLSPLGTDLAPSGVSYASALRRAQNPWTATDNNTLKMKITVVFSSFWYQKEHHNLHFLSIRLCGIAKNCYNRKTSCSLH